MKIASFFSGIGGLELGLEAALSAETVFQCERDPYAVRVLERHWPGVQRHDDITQLEGADIPDADIWCGGFPCQDLSTASRGRGGGINGAKSGLWFAWLGLIASERPAWVVIENVAGAALTRWLPQVRESLYERGYSSLPFQVRACDVGAPFRGSRCFVIAAPDSDGESAFPLHAEASVMPQAPGLGWCDWGVPEAGSLGVAHGVPHLMDRLRCCGNAVVPQAAYVVGLRLREIMDSTPVEASGLSVKADG